MVSDKPTFRFLEEAEADFHESLRYYVEHDRAVAERFDRLIKRVPVPTMSTAGPPRSFLMGAVWLV